VRNVEDKWFYSKGPNKGQPTKRHGKGSRYCVEYEDPDTGKTREKWFKDNEKGKAQAFAADQEVRKNEGRQLSVDGGKKLIREFGPAYVDSLVVKDSTRERYHIAMDKQIIPYLGGQQLRQPTSTTIQSWVRTLEVDDNSPATIELAYKLLAGMFKRAMKDKLIGATPCEDIRLPELPDNDYWLPEHHQVHELAAAMPARYKTMIYIGGGCGLRRAEVFALDEAAIDFTRKVLRVERALLRPKGGGLPMLVTLKTKAARREVPLPDHVIAALKEHIAAGYVQDVQVVDQTAKKKRKGQAHPVVTKRMLFAHGTGKFLWPSAWDKLLKAARDAVDGMDAGFTFHGLRHYFASALIVGGANPKRVAKLCGHASANVTLKVYSHLWKDDEEESRKILNNVFAAGAAKMRTPLAHVVHLPDRQDGEPATEAA
jgi:integrase